MQKIKGFTLIELLVVIAIIGILSGLIIVSMSGAQNSAKDARIKSAMDQMRSTAEIVKMNNSNSYGTITRAAEATPTCDSDAGSFVHSASTIGGADGYALCNDIQSQGTGTLTIYSIGTVYCVQKDLPGDSTWCLDSTGSVGSTNISCDATKATCLSD